MLTHFRRNGAGGAKGRFSVIFDKSVQIRRVEYSYICSIENSPYPNYETTYGNPPVHACIRRRNSRRRVGRPGRPARQHPAPPARPGHLLLLQDPAGCIGGRPRPITDDAARRCLEIPFCGRRRPKPRRVLATGRRPRRLGRDRSSLVLGDAGLRVSDIHQHPLSVRVQAAVDHTRQPDGMLRPKIHRTPKLGRRPGGAALQGAYTRAITSGSTAPWQDMPRTAACPRNSTSPACCDRARTRSP